MKKFALFLLLLLPIFSFGQLFPKVPDFKGNIERIVEKRYGKEVMSSKTDSGVFMPGVFSGWKYIYLFDENSKLIKRTDTFVGKTVKDYEYLAEANGNRRIEKEVTIYYTSNSGNTIVEYENILDSKGQVQKVNLWSINAGEKELLFIENDAEYNDDKLVAFTRRYVSNGNDTISGERFNLFYDNSKRLIRIERKDIELNLKTILYYDYNSQGFVHHFSIDYLVGLRNFDNNQKQDIYYKYDSQGNWIKRYYQISARKKGLEARRSIKYR